MKVTAGFVQRVQAAAEHVRSGGKDLLRKFVVPKQGQPVSEGVSDAPVSVDLLPPGKLDAAKKEKKGIPLLVFPMMSFVARGTTKMGRPGIKERMPMPPDKKDTEMPDAVIPLVDQGVGTITFDTSRGQTMVN